MLRSCVCSLNKNSSKVVYSLVSASLLLYFLAVVGVFTRRFSSRIQMKTKYKISIDENKCTPINLHCSWYCFLEEMPKWSKNWPNNLSKYATWYWKTMEKIEIIFLICRQFQFDSIENQHIEKVRSLAMKRPTYKCHKCCLLSRAHTQQKTHTFILWTERVRIQCCTEHYTFWFRGFQAPCFGPQH